jgi:hypothetical protein
MLKPRSGLKAAFGVMAVLLAMIFVIGSALAPATPVYAEIKHTGTPPGHGKVKDSATPVAATEAAEDGGLVKGQGQGQGQDTHLEAWYAREVKWLETQQKQLDLANTAYARTEAWIADRKTLGEDTAAFEAGLPAFQAQIDAAQAAHDEAAAILAAHAGFDDAGLVADRQEAQKMLVDARKSLNEAHRLLVKCQQVFHHAVRDYRLANKPVGGTAEAEDTEEGEDEP